MMLSPRRVGQKVKSDFAKAVVMVSYERHIEAMDKINSLLAVRERTVKEVKERLSGCGFDQEEVDDAVESALRVGLIDEERYARAFIRGKAHAGWGKLKIVNRLKESGVGDETISSCEDEFNSSDAEYESALLALKKREARSSDPYATYMRRLVNKGFSFDLASRVVKDHLSSEDPSH